MLRIFIKVDLHDLSDSIKLKTEIKHSLLSQQGNSELRGFTFGSEKEEHFASVLSLIVSKVMEKQLCSAL